MNTFVVKLIKITMLINLLILNLNAFDSQEIVELPSWRSDRIFSAGDWQQYIEKAEKFRQIEFNLKEGVIEDAANKLMKADTDGSSYPLSKIYILLRLVYVVDVSRLPRVGWIGNKKEIAGTFPVEISTNNVVSMAAPWRGTKGVYLPLKDLSGLEKECNLRETKLYYKKL